MPLTAGTRLGPYEILAPLGADGMGEVYRARDRRLARDVAVRVLPQPLSSNPEFRARFEREAKLVSSLDHPNICTLFDVGREGDTAYLVKELLEGEKLVDFGLASIVASDRRATDTEDERTRSIALTETGVVLGTAGYLAPEQVRGEKADQRSDLFALGAILFEPVTAQTAGSMTLDQNWNAAQ